MFNKDAVLIYVAAPMVMFDIISSLVTVFLLLHVQAIAHHNTNVRLDLSTVSYVKAPYYFYRLSDTVCSKVCNVSFFPSIKYHSM